MGDIIYGWPHTILYCCGKNLFFSSSNNKNVTEHTADLFPLLKF